MNKKSIVGEITLLIVVIIWGLGFVFQEIGGKQIDPYSLTLVRNFFASIFIGIVIIFAKLFKIKPLISDRIKNKKKMLLGGTLIGLSLGGAMILQQIGVNAEGAGKSGFITSLYVLFVPFISLFFHKRLSPLKAISLVLSLTGLYMINVSDGAFSVSIGTIYLLLCALLFSLQIILIDYYVKDYPPLYLSLIQFIVAAIISIPFIFTLGHFDFTEIYASLPSTLFLGICSSGIAYTLQIVAQKYVNANLASITMSLESVFSLLFGMWILHETHNGIQLGGCAIVFLAVVSAQIEFPNKYKDIKIVFIDLDWTLFNHHTLSYSSKALKALQKVRDKGIKVILNTARCYPSLSTIKALEEVPHDGYICSSGGVAYLDGKYLYKHCLDIEKVNAITKYAKDNKLLLEYITATSAFLSDEENELSKEYYREWLEYHPSIKPYEGEEIVSIVLFDNQGREKEFEQFDVKMYRYYKSCVDLMPIDYHKGMGVKAVIEHYGLDKNQALSIGDARSDIDMFKETKYSVAMGNADESVKQSATHVTSSIDEEGLYKALKRFKLFY